MTPPRSFPSRASACGRSLLDRPSPIRGASLVLLLLGISLATAWDTPSAAQCLEEEIRPSFLSTSSFYGFSVARSGGFLAVGAPGTAALGGGAGAVYTYESIGAEWQLRSILFASGIGAGDQSGATIGLSGNTLVVGVRGDDQFGEDAGSARIFEWTGFSWVETETLSDPLGAAMDEFGASVAIDGDVVVVGSPYDHEVGSETGSATVFRRVGGVWSHEGKLVPSLGSRADTFGNAVAIDADTIVVGAPGANGPVGLDIGAVVVFEYFGSWVETAHLTAPGAQPGDLLGTAVAVAGNLILAGAPFDSDAGLEAGAVVPFRQDGSTWLPEGSFFSPIAGPGQYFGAAIDLDGDEALIGEPFASVSGHFAAGRAHHFLDTGSAFAALDTLEDSLANGSALLGTAVALENGEAFVGAYLDSSGGFGSGTVLRFVTDGDDCDGSGVPDLCEIADGLLTDCDDNGVPDSCQIAAGLDQDCDGNGVLDSCDIAAGSDDCDQNGLLDSCEIALSDCNLNGELDACESDCNANGFPDDCDIASGTVPDCNSNGNPDDCDIFFGISSDCDDNLIPRRVRPGDGRRGGLQHERNLGRV